MKTSRQQTTIAVIISAFFAFSGSVADRFAGGKQYDTVNGIYKEKDVSQEPLSGARSLKRFFIVNTQSENPFTQAAAIKYHISKYKQNNRQNTKKNEYGIARWRWP